MKEPTTRSARRRIESALGALGDVIGRKPWHFITPIGLLTLGLLIQMVSLRVDTSFVGMLPDGDPSLRIFEEFRAYFGCPEQAVLAVRPADGLFSARSMKRLEALQEDIEAQVPFVGDVKSLLNARDTRGSEDELIVDELLAIWPDSPEAWRAVEQRALANPLYQDLFLSRSGAWTLVVVEPDPRPDTESPNELTGFGSSDRSIATTQTVGSITSEQMIDMTDALERVVERHRRADFEIVLGGGVVMGAVLGKGIERDFGLLLGLAVVVIALLLQAFFRSVALVALVLTVVLLSLAGSIGLMAALDVPLDVGTQILPAFLLAVGVGYAVHLLTIFTLRYRVLDDKRVAVREAMEHSGLPILMTALTTMAGLFAFSFSGLTPLERIGSFGPAGVLLAALYDLLLLPALLIVLPLRTPNERTVLSWTHRVLAWFAIFSIRRRYEMLFVLAALLMLAAGQVSKIKVSHNPLHWLPEESEFRRANRLLDEDFGGGYQLELLVRAKQGRSLRESEVLQSMRDLSDALSALETEHVRTSSVIGLHDVVEEIHQALAGGKPEERRISGDARVVAQELLLFESSGVDDLEEVVDSSFEVGRMSVRVNYADAFFMTPFIDRVDALARKHLGSAADIEVTGLFAISHRAFSVLVDSMVRSYLIAMTVIGMFMLVLIGRLREGLLAVIPNLTPIVLTLGIMGHLGIPLDMFTLLVGNIALGLAVDDTIHFVHGYLRDRERGMDPTAAITRTLTTTGSALFISSAALVIGFSVFSLASLDSLMAFGLLASTAIALAFLADLLVMPGLMAILADFDDARAIRLERKERDRVAPPRMT